MRPFLFYIGKTGVPSFMFMIMVASLASAWAALKFSKREKLVDVYILDLAIIAIVASMIGARVFHILIEAPLYYWEKPIRVFYFWQGGFVSLGAFIFTVFSWLFYLRRRKVNVAQYLDLTANVAPIIIFFVRLGCLLNGCCYGKPTYHWPYLIFAHPSSTAAIMHFKGVPLHPTQVYFMLNAVIMFFILFAVRKYRRFYGQVLAVFLMYEGASRFFIEFLRGDEDRGVYFGGAISAGQIVMLLFFAAGVLVWRYCRMKHEA